MLKLSNTSPKSKTVEPDFYLTINTTTDIKKFEFLVNISSAYNQTIAKKLNKLLRNNS